MPAATFDQKEPLGRALLGSIVTHAAIMGAFAFSGFLGVKDRWGDVHASSGAVGVALTKTIPIPSNEGKPNPLANDTDNLAPQEPAEAKPVVKAKAPETAFRRERRVIEVDFIAYPVQIR